MIINFLLGVRNLSVLYLITGVHSSDRSATNYFETYYNEPASNSGRNALKLERYKWPNAIVPYVFDDSYTKKDREMVLAAMKSISDKSCTKFAPKQSSNVEHIRFIKSPACGSSIGYRPNQSEPLDVTYSEYCLTIFGAVQHELLHVLGLFHEQSRPDRDNYVSILWDNIDSRMSSF